ncbi:hypothetical protein Tco_1538614 [Tanacetum coccineum]
MADSAWIETMREELHQFDRLQVWEPVDKPFVAQTNHSPTRLLAGAVQYCVAVCCHIVFSIYQMDVKTAILNGPIEGGDLMEEPVDQTDYHSKIGSLMYLTSSKPNIVQAVCYCARYQARPTEKHLKELFQMPIMRAIDTRKSTSGGIQFLGDKFSQQDSKNRLYCNVISKLNKRALSASWGPLRRLDADTASRLWLQLQQNTVKCLADEPLDIPLDEIQVDEKFHFIIEPIEIMDHEVKHLKQSRIPIVKVRWNSRRGPEFTWERED